MTAIIRNLWMGSSGFFSCYTEIELTGKIKTKKTRLKETKSLSTSSDVHVLQTSYIENMWNFCSQFHTVLPLSQFTRVWPFSQQVLWLVDKHRISTATQPRNLYQAASSQSRTAALCTAIYTEIAILQTNYKISNNPVAEKYMSTRSLMSESYASSTLFSLLTHFYTFAETLRMIKTWHEYYNL